MKATPRATKISALFKQSNETKNGIYAQNTPTWRLQTREKKSAFTDFEGLGRVVGKVATNVPT
jgi:hypothetical protein